jgi:hypothetical protein
MKLELCGLGEGGERPRVLKHYYKHAAPNGAKHCTAVLCVWRCKRGAGNNRDRCDPQRICVAVFRSGYLDAFLLSPCAISSKEGTRQKRRSPCELLAMS